jgi:Protein of unknown function
MSDTMPEIDNLILSIASERWQKMAMIVGVALSECEDRNVCVSGTAVADRIRILVDQRKLEGRGFLQRWRHSEVRLPTDRALAETAVIYAWSRFTRRR